MLELPEAAVIAAQLRHTVTGKKIKRVIAARSPHKFAWFHGDPGLYDALLEGRTITAAAGRGGMVEIEAADGAVMVFCDGVALRYHRPGEEHPSKHQLLIEFADHSALSGTVQMYGGLWCFKEGEFDNAYYRQAKEKPSPLSSEFDRAYFERLIAAPEVRKPSAKAALATEQNIRTIREFQRRYERALAVLDGYEATLRGVVGESEDHLFYLLTVRFGQRIYGAYLAWAQEALALLAERNEETGAGTS